MHFFPHRLTTSHRRATAAHCSLSLFPYLSLRASRKPHRPAIVLIDWLPLPGYYLYCPVTRWSRSALAHKTTSYTSFVWTDGPWGDRWYHMEWGCTNCRGGCRPCATRQYNDKGRKWTLGNYVLRKGPIWLGHILRWCASKITGNNGPLDCHQPDSCGQNGQISYA